MKWTDFNLKIGMPHMVPEQLSEVELMKFLGDCQWNNLAGIIGTPSSKICSDSGDRLYASFINVELRIAPGDSLALYGESTTLYLRSGLQLYAKKFGEGFFILGREPFAEDIQPVTSISDLERCSHSWVYMTSAFVARLAGNIRLKVFRPAGIERLDIPEVTAQPAGIAAHSSTLYSGKIEEFETQAPAIDLFRKETAPIVYPIVRESDLNGAGLLYFARYLAVMNYAERVFLTQRLSIPISEHLIQFLATERRRTFYYANANPTDSVNIYVSAKLTRNEEPHALPEYTMPLKITSRIDMYRKSDSVLMASTLARKALTVPSNIKSVLAESERLLTYFS